MRKSKPLPSQERLKHLFDYDPQTGIFLWRNPQKASHMKPGDVAGWLNNTGYIHMRVDGKIFTAHRVAWMYVYGEDPGELVIDHINRDPLNNRISNLRLSTHSQNIANIVSTNVSWHKGNKKWHVRVGKDGKRHSGGYFFCYEKALAAARQLKQELHGEFAPA